MELEWERDNYSDIINFNGSINLKEVAMLDLDPIEIALLGTPIKKASDFLLALELIFRRYQEREISLNK